MRSGSLEVMIPVNETTLSVSEIFGPTIQGEGASQGRAVVFLRLGMCNLDCKWCDTPYTWDWTGKNGIAYDKDHELERVAISEVFRRLEELVTDPRESDGQLTVTRVVVSGGEPLLQQNRLGQLIAQLAGIGVTTEIETNGTIIPKGQLLDLALDGYVSINCSPKLSNSGIDYDDRIKPDALETIADLTSTYKYVVACDDDILEIEQLHRDILPMVEPHRIFIMPEGTSTEAIASRLQWAMDTASQRGWGISPRLHVIAYGNKRGV